MSGPRPVWKGLLKISLVTIPIQVFPATSEPSGLEFNQLHAACQSRIHQKRWCETCEREVPTSEIVKGFEFSPGKYVILTDEDLASVRPESARVIDLVQFAAAATLDPLYIQRTYYLAPAAAGDGFAVIREAMRGHVGIGTLAIYGRDYLVAVRPRGKTLLLHTLHHAAEIRPAFEEPQRPYGTSVAASQIRLARQVIAAFTGPLNLADYTDAYRAGLQALIDAKIAGKEIVVPAVDTPAVGDLREALTASLAAVARAKKTPAKAGIVVPAAGKKKGIAR